MHLQSRTLLSTVFSNSMLCVMLAVTLSLSLTCALRAQSVPQPPARPNTLVGTVTDTLGTPLSGIEIVIAKLRRRTRTREDGTFRFDSIAPGSYDVTARSMGFIAPTKRATVGPNGGEVRIQMIRFSYALPSMVTTAQPGGLSGVIGDTSYNAMPDVVVTVIGANQIARTNFKGEFFVPLAPGKYLLRLERDGFARQMLGVTIPENEGRKVAAWMVPQSGPPDRNEAHMLFEMNQRITREKGVGTRFFTREDLDKLGESDLQGLTRRFATAPSNDCMVLLNGGPTLIPLWTIDTSELEFLEVYLPSGRQNAGTTSLSGSPTKITTSVTMRPKASPACGNLALIAWLRQ